jgi:putative pyruvate formate lyase activating enzyme
MPETAVIARAAPHFGEEPCISGTRGSGTIFFTGCNLRCVFCQNYQVSQKKQGYAVTPEKLRRICLELCESGVHNINFVTPSHYTHTVLEVIGDGFPVPIVWNSSGYESAGTLKLLRGKVQIFMPDIKYSSDTLALKYSSAVNYINTATDAILEMYRQVGRYKLDSNGIMTNGLLIRIWYCPDSLKTH